MSAERARRADKLARQYADSGDYRRAVYWQSRAKGYRHARGCAR